MRMRKKRHLEPRMERCAALLLARGKPCKNLKEAAENYRELLDYTKVFGNEDPVELEVGCGNGRFVYEKAMREPQTNFLAAELCTNVILTAMERVQAAGLKNVRFLNIPAEILACYLPEHSIRKIYLNFSTPLPANNRERQRLTSMRFLEIYKTLLTAGGSIEQKTDCAWFFDYSMERYREAGFSVGEITRDLHASEYAAANVVTEYEANFAAQGKPICRCVATLPV